MRRQGKGAKSRSKAKRVARKKAIKNGNKAQYAEWKRIGQNTKSARSKLQSKRKKLFSPYKHKIANCGNLGCKRCHPEFRKKK